MAQTAVANITVEELVAVGGSHWQKNSMDRIYFNNLPRWYGLEVDRSGSGAVRSARFRGESISNSRGDELAYAVNRGKLWFDVVTGQFMSQDLSDEMASEMIAAVHDAVEANRLRVTCVSHVFGYREVFRNVEDTEGRNIPASHQRYIELLTEAIQQVYPSAIVDVNYHEFGQRHTEIDGLGSVELVDELANEIIESGAWAVRS